jgi:hypothetical protein
MKIIYDNGFTYEQQLAFVPQIQEFTLQNMRNILYFCQLNKIPFKKHHQVKEFVLSLTQKEAANRILTAERLTVETAVDIKTLWETSAIKQVFSASIAVSYFVYKGFVCFVANSCK